MSWSLRKTYIHGVTPRKGRVSRNYIGHCLLGFTEVTPRKGRVSRNDLGYEQAYIKHVTPRKGRVSRNRAYIG